MQRAREQTTQSDPTRITADSPKISRLRNSASLRETPAFSALSALSVEIRPKPRMPHTPAQASPTMPAYNHVRDAE
jgi:hypothetical protein